VAVAEAVAKKDSRLFSAIFRLADARVTEVIRASECLAAAREPSAALFEDFFDAVRALEYPWIFLMPAGEELQEIVLRSRADARVFFQPSKPTRLMRFQDELLKLKKTLAAGEDRLEARKAFERALVEFRWVGVMHFWGSRLTRAALLEQARSAKEKPKEKIAAVNADLTWLKKTCAETSYRRQSIAEACAIASSNVLPALEAASTEMKSSYSQAMWLMPPEFLAGLRGNAIPTSAILRERERGFGLTLDKNKEIVLLTGARLARRLAQALPATGAGASEVRGVCASLGCEGGRARGRARLVFSPADVARFEKGEILVAPETTPDLVIAAGKAIAIVTDVGGVTSHAAVLARELGIPCVVGTQVATRLFKDGDLIKVDAAAGVVRKVK
jgi:phosphohistidine swiveling domain-containing protein